MPLDVYCSAQKFLIDSLPLTEWSCRPNSPTPHAILSSLDAYCPSRCSLSTSCCPLLLPQVFFIDSLKFFLSLYGHKLPVLCMDISSDSTLLVSGSADKNIKVGVGFMATQCGRPTPT